MLDPKIFYWLSAAELELGNNQGAIERLEKAQKLEPFNPEIDYQIAAILYRRQDLDKAKNILEKKIAENGFLPPKYFLSLAEISLERENQQEAFHWLDRGSKLFPFNPDLAMSAVKTNILQHNGYLFSLRGIYFHLYQISQEPYYLNILLNLSL